MLSELGLKLLAATGASTKTAAEAESGLAALGIDPVAIILQSGTFVLLFVLVKRFALDKINHNLTRREKTIQEGLVNAQEAERALESADQKQAEILRQARAEADNILAQAHEQAGVIAAEAEQKAVERNERLLADARAQIAAELERAQTKLQAETLDLVAEATAAVLKQKIDSKADQRLISEALEASRE